MKKWTQIVRVGLLMGVACLQSTRKIYAHQKPITLQEALAHVVKKNVDISIAKHTAKAGLISNKMANFNTWMPKARVVLEDQLAWINGSKKHACRLDPIIALEWELGQFSNKVFDTLIRKTDNTLHQLRTTKVMAEKERETVNAYYALALEQKKNEHAHTAIQIATSGLKAQAQRLKLGLISSLDHMHAGIALKEAQLTALKQREALKTTRRAFNLLLQIPLNEATVVETKVAMKPLSSRKLDTQTKTPNWDTVIKEQELKIASQQLKKAKCMPLACINLSGILRSDGYTYPWGSNIIEQTSKHSAGMGLTLTVDLGTFLLWPAQIKVARIAFDRASMALEKQQETTEGDMENKRWNYRQAIAVHKIAVEQLKLNKQKLALVKEQYRLKQTEFLKLQKAQAAVQEVEITLIQAAFEIKKAEYELYPCSLAR
ncbi:MAG TPA: TolC family protein [Amoebophilaceae bacterium]|jgi:hypothetical protein|nr:TolC family protein [Amoebophilaceae bacterium]